MPKIGPVELIIVLVIVLLIFGVGRLGRLGKDLGEGIREFRKSLSGSENKDETESSSSKEDSSKKEE